MTDNHELAHAIVHLTHELKEGREHRRHDTQLILKTLEIMSKAIETFVAAQNAVNDQIDTAVTDLQADVKNLNEQIALLQSTSGQITPEDQALLDGIQARSQKVADQLNTLAAVTPPVPPPVSTPASR